MESGQANICLVGHFENLFNLLFSGWESFSEGKLICDEFYSSKTSFLPLLDAKNNQFGEGLKADQN